MSRAAFDNRGNKYNVSAILTDEGTLDIEKYKQYSPLFLSCVFHYVLHMCTVSPTMKT